LRLPVADYWKILSYYPCYKFDLLVYIVFLLHKLFMILDYIIPSLRAHMKRKKIELVLISDSNSIFLYIFWYYKPSRSSSDSNTFSLPNCVAKCSLVFTNNFSWSIDDVTWFFSSFFSRNSFIETFPIKQSPWLSFLWAFGSHAFSAISRTSDLRRCPMGNIAFESWKSERRERK